MDHERLAGIYQQNRDSLVRAAARVLGERPAAEDVVQEAWVRALRTYGDGAGAEAVPSPAWLFRVTLNLCYDRLRVSQRARLATEATLGPGRVTPGRANVERAAASPVADPEESAARWEVVEAVRAAITALPTALREAIVLREYCDLKYREIAAAVGCPVGTVMSRLHLARQRLKKTLAPYLELGSGAGGGPRRQSAAGLGDDGVAEVKRAGGRG